MNSILKKLLPHLLAVAAMLAICIAYLGPQLSGERLVQGDIIQAKSMRGELHEFRRETGTWYYWNNSMFAGMPNGLIHYGKKQNLLVKAKVERLLNLGFKMPIAVYLRAMLLTYIILIMLGVNPWLATLGGILLSLNVNHTVVYEAGHTHKFYTVSYLSLVVGGAILALRRKKRLTQVAGALAFGFGAAMAIASSHPQMLYYTFLVFGLWYLIDLGFGIAGKDYKHKLIGTGMLAVMGVIALLSNFAQVNSTLNFSKSTMRGEPILEQKQQAEPKSSSEVEGLEWNYAMNWSNGAIDLLGTIIPRAAGGSSAEEVSGDTEMGSLLRRNGNRPGSDGNYRAPMYWGGLPFTGGPAYIGALTFLFIVLSFFTLPKSMRWAFGAAMAFALLISMGKNAEWLNRTLFDHLPYFNKFRAHNSILHGINIVFVLPAILGVSALFKMDKAAQLKTLTRAGGIAAGFLLLMALIGPSMFSFTSEGDQGYQQAVRNVLISDRKALFRADAFRSFAFVALSAGLIYAYLKGWLKQKTIMYGGLIVLGVLDLFTVNRRYLDKDSWQTKSAYEQNFAARPVDQQIDRSEPKGRGYYRVHDLSINTYNSATTSYHHNTIGGYNAAKLQRYQDMIDYYLARNEMKVLNMLNAKYIINRDGQVQVNPGALGNAWFVQDVRRVNTPEQEIESVGQIEPAQTAVFLPSDFEDVQDEIKAGDGSGNIELVDYTPDRLVYNAQSGSDQLAVFSEVWYPDGWKAYVDGEEVPIVRVNYILRSIPVPSGNHEIVFEYEPKAEGKSVSLAFSALLSLMLLGMIGWRGYAFIINAAEEEAELQKSASAQKKTDSKKKISRSKKSKGKTNKRKKK